MKLQIIVTHFNEPIGFVERFLDSLKVQDYIDKSDFEVLLINDGNEQQIPETLLSTYPFSIKYLVKEWGGISAARQFGQNNATADYIMFCDCDDLFLRIDALYQIFTKIDEHKYDLIVGGRLQDLTGTPTIVSATQALLGHEIHNKVYKLAFLQKNNILWNKDIVTWHEDFYFNSLCLSYNPSIAKNETISYIWKVRPNSISAEENKNFTGKDKQLILLFDRYITVLLELKARDRIAYFKDKLSDLLLLLYGAYYKNDSTSDVKENCISYANKTIELFATDILKINKKQVTLRLQRLDYTFCTDLIFNPKSLTDWWKSLSQTLTNWME